MNRTRIVITNGSLAIDAAEEAAAQRRRELREKLLRGEEVVVTQQGEVTDRNHKKPNETAITVPEGKLASNFYWYERDTDLYREEVTAMQRFFPNFKQVKISDGRLSWEGILSPRNLKPGARWFLQAVYEHNHPNNTTYGGSIKVYSISPDLQDVTQSIGAIPHTLRDSTGQIYICTARKEDFRASYDHSTSAASALAWAAKWIAAFELWMAGDLTTSEFSSHSI